MKKMVLGPGEQDPQPEARFKEQDFFPNGAVPIAKASRPRDRSLSMSKRKAWDQAIQQVAAQTGSKITVPGKRESEKRETRRRVNARRWIATSDVDDLRRKTEARLEALEEADHLGESTEVDDDEWVDDEEVRRP